VFGDELRGKHSYRWWSFELSQMLKKGTAVSPPRRGSARLARNRFRVRRRREDDRRLIY
jgi:hypothetical protein